MEKRVELLLRDCQTAINDWVVTYASEFCHEEDVRTAHERIADNGGTLAYTGRLLAAIKDALKESEVSAGGANG